MLGVFRKLARRALLALRIASTLGGVVKRVILFAVWGVVGLVLSYTVLYAFSPLGLSIIAPAVAALAVGRRGKAWSPETLGLLAGAGTFCLVVAAGAEAPSVWVALGVSLVGGALLVYVSALLARSGQV